MEIILELLFTAFVSLLFSFLIAKLVSFAMDADSGADEFKVQSFESENKVERELEVELKAKVDDIVVENEIEELEVQNEIKVQFEERQMKGHVEEEEEEEEKGMKLESYDDDDDWEGIEKSELENVFGKAVKFREKNEDLGLGDDVEMELYGLHKIATEGACRESQPMGFMLSSRSKWNAWQKLGNMNPETAMEQYVTLLSDKVPGWMEDDSDVSSVLSCRNADLKSAPGVGDITASTSSEKQVNDD